MFAGVERPNKAQLAAAIEDLCEHQVDGLVLGVRVAGNIDFVRKLCRGVPFVTLDVGARDVPTVIVDQQQGTRLATQHLLGLGHRQICLHRRAAELVGVQRTPKGLGRGPQTRWLWNWALASKAIGVQRAGLRPQVGCWESAAGQFTAIVAANDHMALGILRALHAEDIQVPEQISVVGYDDLPESQFFEPPLTTIHHDFARQGERCVEVLLSMINRQTVDPTLQLLSPELVIRESTAVATR